MTRIPRLTSFEETPAERQWQQQRHGTTTHGIAVHLEEFADYASDGNPETTVTSRGSRMYDDIIEL